MRRASDDSFANQTGLITSADNDRLSMVTRCYTVRFLTPAFLGDAEQNAEWRTPPFKALLRQWWRVFYLSGREPSSVLLSKMRQTEGQLFGNAWLEPNAEDRAKPSSLGHCRSLVRMRLEVKTPGEAWAPGTQKGVDPMGTGLETSYSWFGLIRRKDRLTKQPLPDRTGIRPMVAEGERNLRIAVPRQHLVEIESALQLISAFGQLGSRARAGWGTIHIEGLQLLSEAQIRCLCRDWRLCLGSDWAHAFGCDARPWVWESGEEFKDWPGVLSRIAVLRRGVRSSLKADSVDMRMLLGFAAEKTRMPSPLRWRVLRVEPTGKLKVRAFALPHAIPVVAGKDSLNRHSEVAWKIVVSALDRSLQRTY